MFWPFPPSATATRSACCCTPIASNDICRRKKAVVTCCAWCGISSTTTPEGTGTDTVKALDVVNHVLHRRAIVFLISDFESPKDPAAARAELRRAMRQTNRRHDLIAVHVEDPREKELPDVGILALEDAETGEIIELDTASASGPQTLQRAVARTSRRLVSDFRSEGVDTLQLQTDSPYIPALQRFFKTRERRRV